MIEEGKIFVGRLPSSMSHALDRLERFGLSLSIDAVNIFNHKPPLTEDVPDAYLGSGRRMAVNEKPGPDEHEVLREILRQVEGVSPSEEDPPTPSDKAMSYCSFPTYVIATKDEICNWQVPHRDGWEEKDAAVLLALSPRGANFLFWGRVEDDRAIRRTDGMHIRIDRGQFVFFSHRQVHSGGAYASANVRLYWSFKTTAPPAGESTTVPVKLAQSADDEEKDQTDDDIPRLRIVHGSCSSPHSSDAGRAEQAIGGHAE